MLALACLALSFIFAREIFGTDEILHAPGVLAPEAPRQTLIANGRPWEFKNYRITPLATYDIRARVLGKERYRFGRESALSPYDFALGWGPMSDQAVVQQLKISQSGRWYYWQAQTLPLPKQTLITSSANTHLIPAKSEIAERLGLVRVGEVITLRGKLVAVTGSDGWQWRSSLRRDDTGQGACEVFWVEEVSAGEIL
jgi:hypothetical protein